MTIRRPPHTQRTRRGSLVLCSLLCCQCVSAVCFAERAPAASRDEQQAKIEDELQSRLRSQPNDPVAWRLLGRVRLKGGDLPGASEALQRAVELDPDGAAAHFDFARCLWSLNRREEAKRHFELTVELAPESDYAREAKTFLAQSAETVEQGEITQIGFDVKRFDGSEVSNLPPEIGPSPFGPPASYYFRLETGLLYNSNVALAPISRELSPGTRASFQSFLAPELEYRLVDDGLWRAGPAFAGYFNLNEGNFRSFNLQNYQPGFFVQRTLLWNETILIPRLQYDFAHDEFDGHTFGNRHALTASTAADWSPRHVSFAYWMIDHTNFIDDGVFPAITSRDGWTNTLGLNHTLYTGYRHLALLRGGADVQWADTTGSDFTYRGVSLYADAEMPIDDDLSLLLRGGWGYRDYPDFQFTPSRNEHIWRAGAELRKRITDHWSAALVFNFDRFNSRNELFDATRYVTGLVTRFEF